MEIVLEVPEKDVARVLELVKGIKRVKIKSPRPAPSPASQQLLTDLAGAVEQVKKITRGEAAMPTQTLVDLLDELETELAAETPAQQPA